MAESRLLHERSFLMNVRAIVCVALVIVKVGPGMVKAGVFVHHGTNIHLHFVSEDRETSGHIDALTLSEASVLYLPVSALRQQKHSEGVNKRGDMAMGFDHSKTTHHFRLYKAGGAIGVDANDPKDTGSRDAIRRHLQMIAKMFAKGNFDLPMFIHATTPPGMETMKKLRKSITYHYEETAQGAQVRLSTQDPQALAAIQKFLRFQIEDHKTGDPTTIQN